MDPEALKGGIISEMIEGRENMVIASEAANIMIIEIIEGHETIVGIGETSVIGMTVGTEDSSRIANAMCRK